MHTKDMLAEAATPAEPDYKACFFDTLKMLHEAIDVIEAIDSECLLPPQLQDLVDAVLVHRDASTAAGSSIHPAQASEVQNELRKAGANSEDGIETFNKLIKK